MLPASNNHITNALRMNIFIILLSKCETLLFLIRLLKCNVYKNRSHLEFAAFEMSVFLFEILKLNYRVFSR